MSDLPPVLEAGTEEFPGETINLDDLRGAVPKSGPMPNGAVVGRQWPAVVEKKPVGSTGAELVAFAVAEGFDIDKLAKLIEMKNAEEDRAARREFAMRFSAMQADFSPVFRDGEAVDRDNNNRLLYTYASLDAILKAYAPIIARHGFSYRWTEEIVKEGEKRIWCIVSGYGHEERTYEDIPIQAATKFSNAIQQRGITTSYGKRYSFMSLFGVIIADEDDDAQSLTFDLGVTYSQEIELLRECRTNDELVATIRKVYAGKSPEAKKMLMRVKELRQAELNNPEARQ